MSTSSSMKGKKKTNDETVFLFHTNTTIPRSLTYYPKQFGKSVQKGTHHCHSLMMDGGALVSASSFFKTRYRSRHKQLNLNVRNNIAPEHTNNHNINI